MGVTSYLQFVLALVFVLALIGAAAMLARRFGLGHAARPAGRNRRLCIVESLPLDAKHRLILLRRDGVEHLIVLGAASGTVVERGIVAAEIGFGAALRAQEAVITAPTEPTP